MARTALTDARIGALRPRKIAYDIRDGKLGGFGVRVLPSGRKRFFVHSQQRGDRVWKILGDAATMSVDEARSSAVCCSARWNDADRRDNLLSKLDSEGSAFDA